MNFDYSKLTAQDMLDFYLLAIQGIWGFSAGSLQLLVRVGIDLRTIPAIEQAAVVARFWDGFQEHIKQDGIEKLFKGGNNGQA